MPTNCIVMEQWWNNSSDGNVLQTHDSSKFFHKNHQNKKETSLHHHRLDPFLVPKQCRGNSGCFPSSGKRAAIVRRYPGFFLSLCAVFSCFHTKRCEIYSFTTDGYGILNCSQIWVRAVHTKGGQAQTRLHTS